MTCKMRLVFSFIALSFPTSGRKPCWETKIAYPPDGGEKLRVYRIQSISLENPLFGLQFKRGCPEEGSGGNTILLQGEGTPVRELLDLRKRDPANEESKLEKDRAMRGVGEEFLSLRRKKKLSKHKGRGILGDTISRGGKSL